MREFEMTVELTCANFYEYLEIPNKCERILNEI